MAISKLILNGEVQMDVTSNTNTSNNMLNGVVGTKNDGTSVTGNIASKSSSDLTISGATVTAPAGYYANAASKAVNTTTHPNPSASIASSTGVVTASHTQTTGYVTSGTTTSTMQLTSQAAATYYPSTADQTIASYKWLTGTQTIKSVTTSNLTAANIAEGVVVKVGDANNASRITQITGTHSGATSYTATISGTGNSSYCYVTYAGTKRYTNGTTFTYKAGDTLTIYCRGNNVKINGDSITLSSYSYTYTLPVGDITIALTYSSSTSNNIIIQGLIKPTGTLTVSAAGTNDVYKYALISVPEGQVGYPTATKGTVSNHSISVTPRVNISDSGYVDAGVLQGTAVSVSASELVSGNLPITENGNNINVANYATVSVDVSSSGGSSYVLHSSNLEITANVTSTSATILSESLTCDSSAINESTMIFVKIRDKAGKRNGYFYGSDTIFTCVGSGRTGWAQSYRSTRVYRYNDNHVYMYTLGGTTGYGVYVSSIDGAGALTVQGRYSSSYSLTIDGTYSIEVYTLEWPNNEPPYNNDAAG